MPRNILLITSDQQRHDHFGFEKAVVQTPHLDRLARGGTRFSACITPNLVCQPSRASILTGLLPLTHGVWDNGVDLEPEVGAQGFAETLARAGWRTAFIGKAHFATKNTYAPTGTPEDRFNGALYEGGWAGPYMGFQHAELCVLGHFNRVRPIHRPVVGHYERWFLSRGRDEEAYRLWQDSTDEEVGAAQTWHSALPVAWHTSTWVADRTLAWLNRQGRDKPFCAWVSFPDPHHPFDAPLPWSRMYDPKDVTLPKHRRPDLDRRPWWHRASLEGVPDSPDPMAVRFRTEASRVVPQSDLQLAHMTANTYGMVSLIDHSVGRILEGLASLGLAEDTLVIYTTDHGELLGNHGLYLKGPTPYEDLLRVGMIVAGPGVARGTVVREPVSTLDLTPTMLDFTGQTGAAPFQGRSLLPLASGGAEQRDAAYSEWDVHPARCGVGLSLRTIRTATAKCTFELNSGAGELYDLVNDPEEMENRFDDPASRGLRRQFEELLRARPGPLRRDLKEPIGMA